MDVFIKTDRGWVNSEHVATIEAEDRPDGHVSLTFRSANGDRLGHRSRSTDDEWTGAAVVAAAPGAVAVVFEVAHSSELPPSEVYAQRVPIVAWRVLHEREAVPVLPVEHDPDAVMIEMPDGRLEWPYTAIFDTIDDAKTEFLNRAVSSWNIDQRRAVAKAAAS